MDWKQMTVGILLFVVGSVPLLATEGWTLDFSGYSQERYEWNSNTTNNDRTRLRLDFSRDNKSCGFSRVEFEVSAAEDGHADLERSNWLQQAYLVCSFDKTEVSLGRLFVRTGYSTYWPGSIITARYTQSYPWQGYFGYGVDVNQSAGKWELAGSLSGATDLDFDDSGQFSRVDFSGRALRLLGERGHYSFVLQASDAFRHSGWEFRYNMSSVSFSGGVFHSDADDTPFSMLVQVDWSVSELVALHLQGEERVNGNAVGTAGVGVSWKGAYVVLDYEHYFSRNDGTFLTAVRYNW